MNQEIEIKLEIAPELHEIFINYMKEEDCAVFVKSESLKNDYFDTKTHRLRDLKMGLRIREAENYKEQTIKTAGSVMNGIHARHEYNFAISADRPNLNLFPKSLWPQGCDIEQIQQELRCLFSTHFLRKTWKIEYKNTQFEVVLDHGCIMSEFLGIERKLPISEIELELISGASEVLEEFAQLLINHFDLKKSDISKAQRGYSLL